jgi:TolB protein
MTRVSEERARGLFHAALLLALTAGGLMAQQQKIVTDVFGEKGGKPSLAVIDFKGTGTQQFMATFNSTLFGDLQHSGLFNMVAKSFFPLNNPQRPEDLKQEDNKQGFALQDWAGSPTMATHLAFGYTGVVNGVLVLYGNVYDTRQPNIQSAQLMAQRYTGSVDEAGAIKVAHEFANDIIQKFGGSGSLLGSRIYYVSKRSSAKDAADELYVMDWDGNNQKPLTNLKSLLLSPGVSPDGTRVAFTTFARGTPRIMVLNTETGRQMPFYNQEASMNTTPNFTPDGKQIYYSSSASGIPQIYVADINGQGFRRITHRDNAILVEPKVNPKNANMVLFVGGPGPQQIYRMNAEGADVQRVTNGEGEASNPSWSPDGQRIAFSWTRGYQKGDWNIFVMDIGSGQYTQLTHSEGRNENPVWAPDGRHLVFASTRTGHSQIYTMLADGSQVKQLTQQGSNRSPVWGVK